VHYDSTRLKRLVSSLYGYAHKMFFLHLKNCCVSTIRSTKLVLGNALQYLKSLYVVLNVVDNILQKKCC